MQVSQQVTVWRTTNPTEQTSRDRIGQTGIVLRTDGTRRPLQIGFGGAQDEQDEQNWFWHADLAPVPKQGDRVTIVRATNPKEPACVGHVGQTGTVTHTDGKGRPYQVGFDGLELWFWPSDVFPAVPADDTKARGYLVPDEASQNKLGLLGFDLRAPKSSFDDSPSVQARPTYFGGAHVSLLGQKGGVATLAPDCYRQLQAAADYCRTNAWQLPSLTYHEGKYQPGYYFEAGKHATTFQEAGNAALACGGGWTEAKQDRFHVGLYSSTLEERPTVHACDEMKAVLVKAQWGFVLARNRGGDDVHYFFDWATWQPITAPR